MRILYLFVILMTIPSLLAAQRHPRASTSDSPLQAGGIRSRNAELVDIIPFQPGGGDIFDVQSVYYGNHTIFKRVIVTGWNENTVTPNVDHVRVIDVTTPRTPNGHFIKIKVGYVDGGTPKNAVITNVAAYTDKGTYEEASFLGDTWLVFAIRPIQVKGIGTETTADDESARYVIVNLTKAVELVGATASNTIEIPDLATRDVLLNGVATSNADVYVGYVKVPASYYEYYSANPTYGTYNTNPVSYKPHEILCDEESGVLVEAPIYQVKDGSCYRGTVDLFDLSVLSTAVTVGSTTPYVMDRLKTASGAPVLFSEVDDGDNTLCFTDGCDGDPSTKPLSIGGAMASKIGSNMVRIYAASSSLMFRNGVASGGAATIDVDYSTPTAITTSNQTYWHYDNDRRHANRRVSPDDWNFNLVHTHVPFKHTNGNDVLALTCDEMIVAKATRASSPSVVGGIYQGGAETIEWRYDPEACPGDPPISPVRLENDLRFGSFTRVWSTQTSSGVTTIDGTGTHDGPLSLYDAIEAPESIDDRLYFASRKAVDDDVVASPSSIEIQGHATSNKHVGPNTVHRAVPVYPHESDMFSLNANDVFIAGYASGLSVINLGATPSTGVVQEKAFFDFIPTLTYNINDPYFYKAFDGGGGASPELSTLFPILHRIPFYQHGVWHVGPDFGTSRQIVNGGTLHPDEKFVYLMGYGEGAVDAGGTDYPSDHATVRSLGRNWINGGGFLVVRYFDGKLGGTLTGYTGGNQWSDRSYREVNLLGAFDVERDVTVASGATVNILAGHAADPGVANATVLTTTNKTIYVDGTLNISVPGGDADGTTIVIDVPIVVRAGGSLNVYTINPTAHVIFKKKVTVNGSAGWTMHPGSNVELFEEKHVCNGRFTLNGTNTARVTFTGRRAAGLVTVRGSQVVGKGSYPPLVKPWTPLFAATTNVNMLYADCINAHFDFESMQTRVGVPEIDQCTFLRTTLYNPKPWMVSFVSPIDYYSPFDPIPFPPSYVHNVTVQNSTFNDVIATPGQEWAHGLFVSKANKVTVSNTQFTSMKTGCFVIEDRQLFVTDCRFEANDMGMVSEGVAGKICNSTFIGNEFSSVTGAEATVEFYDNFYTGCMVGAGAWAGGQHWFRNNTFGAYGRGLRIDGVTAYLRDRVVALALQEEEFGRNNFQAPANQFTWKLNTVGVNDIAMTRGSRLYVDCGFNDFNQNSAYHVWSDGSCPPFNANNNRWPGAGGIFAPRVYNIGWMGIPLNVQQDVEEQCGPVLEDNECMVTPCMGPVITYLGLFEATSDVYSAVGTLRTTVNNSSLDPWCRRGSSWEYFQAVMHTDSTALYTTLKSDMQTIASNVTLPAYLRSTALHVKARTHIALNELDSARSAYTAIVGSFSATTDAVPANWGRLYIDVLEDVTGVADSLRDVHIERIFTDLRVATSSGGFSKDLPSTGTVSEDGSLSLLGIAPNPAAAACSVQLSTSEAGPVHVEVVSLEGVVLYAVDATAVAGTTTVPLSLSAVPAGYYMVRCSRGTQRASLPLSVFE